MRKINSQHPNARMVSNELPSLHTSRMTQDFQRRVQFPARERGEERMTTHLSR
jgi:hypothetical protein